MATEGGHIDFMFLGPPLTRPLDPLLLHILLECPAAMKEEPLPTETNSELLTYYHPPTKLREGDVFSRVSVCPQAGWVVSHHAGPQPPSPRCTGPWPQFPFVQSTSPGPDMLNLLYYEARMVGKQTFGMLWNAFLITVFILCAV